jgi:hypothetical protein
LTGLTTVNLLVKYAETSLPRVAISAISSADGAVAFVLDIFDISLFFLHRGSPGRHQMIIFAFRIMPDLEYH